MRLPAKLRLALFASLMLIDGCACDRPPVLTVGATVVRVEESGVVVEHAGRLVTTFVAADVKTLEVDPFYDMQFGMFDIQETIPDVRQGDAIVIEEVTDDALRFSVTLAGEVIASGVVSAGGVTADDVRITLTSATTNAMSVGLVCQPDHHFLGLGAQSADVDHRGQIVPLWVSEQGVGKAADDILPTVWQVVGRRHTTHVPMPAFVRSDGTGVVVDVKAFSRFDLCATSPTKATLEVWQPELSLHLLPAQTVLGAQQALSEALGRPRLLPPYVFAPWNDAIFSEQIVRDFADFLREREIPTSAIWSEDWRGGSDSGALYRLDADWRLDRAVYPTYEQMAQTFTDQGIAHQVYFNTFVTQGGDVFDEITAQGFDIRRASDGTTYLFDGVDKNFSPTTLLDLTNPAASAYVKDHLKGALALGARGWMADFAEWLPVEDVALADGSDPRLTHNLYPVLWAQVNREAIAEAGLLDEVITYSRSGFLGSPAVVDVMWAGDQRTSFQADDGLPTIIPIGIGTGVTGFTYYAHDIAGYQSSTNAPVDQELFFRWTELGAFTPVMRTHHGTHARENHMLQTNEESTAHWKRYAEIHIRLYPYLRALAVADATARTDVAAGLGRLPLWVAMPLLYPTEDALWAITDQVLLGPSLLVAPITAASQVSRDVLLPAGRWVAFPMPGAPEGSLGRRREAFTGGAFAAVGAEVGEIPVFMPAGAVVPMTATAPLTLLDVPAGNALDGRDLDAVAGDREVIVALGQDGAFIEEDGARYTLVGAGTGLPTDADADGAVTVTGNASITGDGFTLTLAGHPDGRVSRVVFR